jgi:AcrR family transcriptional regulator
VTVSATSAGPRGRPSRREQALDAAAELFARLGFHGVSIDDIGAAVGISGPGLYRHFASKEAILGQLLVSISERLLAEARRRIAGIDDPGRALRALVDWHVEFALDNPALITVQGRDLASLGEADRRRVRQLQRRYVEVWVSVLREVVSDADEQGARAAAHAVFGLINATPHSARLGRAATAGLLRRMAIAALVTPGTLAPSAADPVDASPDLRLA